MFDTSLSIDRDVPLIKSNSARDLLVLVLAWVCLIAAVNPIGNFPINDDWVYAESVRSMIDNGRFIVHSTSTANVGPQVYWGALFAWPFGFSFTALRFSTLVLGLSGGIGVYWLFVELWKDRRIALIGALCLLVNPIYCALANSFMTDVPFLAIAVFSMLAIVKGLRGDRAGLLLVGLALAAAAILIRQLALFLLVGFAIAYVARYGFRPRVIAVAVLPLILGFALNWSFNEWLIETGRKADPPGTPPIVLTTIPEMLRAVASSAFTVLNYMGLFLLPLVILCFPGLKSRTGKDISWPWRCAVLLTLLLGYVFVARGLTAPLGGNILHWFGIGPLANRDTHLMGLNLPIPSRQSALAWQAVTALAVLASSLIAVTIARELLNRFREWRSGELRMNRATIAQVLFFAGAAASYYFAILIVIAIGYSLFDRYLLPLVVFCGLSIPWMRKWSGSDVAATPARLRGAAIAIVAMGVFSGVATHDFLAWNETRWSALQALMNDGISPHRIDGGYEFNGWYLFDPRYRIARGKSYWWVDDDEFVVGSGPIPGYREIRRIPVDRWWKGDGSDVFILRRIAH